MKFINSQLFSLSKVFRDKCKANFAILLIVSVLSGCGAGSSSSQESSGNATTNTSSQKSSSTTSELNSHSKSASVYIEFFDYGAITENNAELIGEEIMKYLWYEVWEMRSDFLTESTLDILEDTGLSIGQEIISKDCDISGNITLTSQFKGQYYNSSDRIYSIGDKARVSWNECNSDNTGILDGAFTIDYQKGFFDVGKALRFGSKAQFNYQKVVYTNPDNGGYYYFDGDTTRSYVDKDNLHYFGKHFSRKSKLVKWSRSFTLEHYDLNLMVSKRSPYSSKDPAEVSLSSKNIFDYGSDYMKQKVKVSILKPVIFGNGWGSWNPSSGQVLVKGTSGRLLLTVYPSFTIYQLDLDDDGIYESSDTLIIYY